jgi:RNase P subunit RPR2
MDKDYDPNAEYRRLPLLPLPAACPLCSAKLRKGDSVKRFDFRALGIGFLISVFLFLLVFGIWPAWFKTFFVGWTPNFDDPAWILFGAPFLMGFRLFLNYDNMVIMKCSACHWEKEFLDKNRKKFPLDSSVSTKNEIRSEGSADEDSHPVYIVEDDNAGIAWEPDFSYHPTHCPDCHKELMEPRARRPRWVPVMVALFAFHMIVGIPLLLFLYDSEWISFLTGKIRLPVFIVLAALPALSTAYYRSSGRILPYECYSCGWKKSYSLSETRKYDLPEEAYR